jgi:hypothetical protein
MVFNACFDSWLGKRAIMVARLEDKLARIWTEKGYQIAPTCSPDSLQLT